MLSQSIGSSNKLAIGSGKPNSAGTRLWLVVTFQSKIKFYYMLPLFSIHSINPMAMKFFATLELAWR